MRNRFPDGKASVPLYRISSSRGSSLTSKTHSAVTNSGFLKIVPRIASHFVQASIRHFDPSEKEHGLKRAYEATRSSRSSGRSNADRAQAMKSNGSAERRHPRTPGPQVGSLP